LTAIAEPAVEVLPEAGAEAEEILRDGLQRVLPPLLVEASSEARDTVATFSPESNEGTDLELASLAAALGASAATAVASALAAWLTRRSSKHPSFGWPRWMRPALDPSRSPKLATLTEFSQLRTQYVREALEGVPILLTRHGSVVAALVPLQPGAYEDSVYPEAMRKVTEAAEERLSTTGVEARALTADELATIRNSDDPAAAGASFGLDTGGWAHLNPPQEEGASEGHATDASSAEGHGSGTGRDEEPAPAKRRRRTPARPRGDNTGSPTRKGEEESSSPQAHPEAAPSAGR